MTHRTYRYEDPINSSADALNAVRSLLTHPDLFDFLFCAYGPFPELSPTTKDKFRLTISELSAIALSEHVPETVATCAKVIIHAFRSLMQRGGDTTILILD